MELVKNENEINANKDCFRSTTSLIFPEKNKGENIIKFLVQLFRRPNCIYLFMVIKN